MDEAGYLTDVVETSNFEKVFDGETTKATVGDAFVDLDSYVSMNMWRLTPEFIQILERGFEEFFKTSVTSNPLKAEYLLPIYIKQLLREGKVSVKVLETADKWFGVTCKEDKELVTRNFKKLIEVGGYQKDLYSDL